MAVELMRRAGTEGCKTYWLDVRGRGGFLRVHTASITNPRQVDPELERLAAMVEAAPQLVQALADLAAASWLEPDPCDSEELAQAKRAALAALAAATGGK
ncbi:hypothetical protein P3D58_19245 [Pseudomonas aeruginosa]|uniref:hypothetical protein n=1 Tax=Pseudomonas aeruginosa TaxID=287 RepID=UPI001ADBA8FF|nr:hypothetical protein [Pseudomonas aeruginosa]EKV4827950.1 hypothetical protein [Pseudomonas aeruginosa]